MDTGMMIGEIVALKVSDIDLENQLIHINKRAQRTKNDDIGSKTIYEVYDVEWPMLRDITIPKELFFYLQENLKDKESDCYLTSNLYVDHESGTRGYQEKNDIMIFASETKTVQVTAETLIHEITHHKYNIGKSQWAER